MASTYTDAGIELISVGEQSNTWGQTTNTNWRLIEELATGIVSINLTGLTSYSLTTTDGVTSNGRHLVIEFTGLPGATSTVSVVPDNLQKVYFVNNQTDQSIVLTQGSGGNVTVPAGTKKIVYCDGAGSGAKVTDVTENLSLSGEVNVTTFKIDGVEVTADASEINTLDGLTASTAELNILDGLTASTAELNKLNGLTASTAELNILDGVTASTEEINYLDGATSGIQGQIDSLESTTISAGGGLTGGGSLAANRTISHADTSSQGSVNNSGNTAIQDITLDTYGHVTGINSKTIEPMPVGATYIQFPGYDAPNSLFGGTWSAIFDNEGIFFRTPGSGASSFGGGIQGDAIRNITGTIRSTVHSPDGGAFRSASGVFSVEDFDREGPDGFTFGTNYRTARMDVSRQVPTADENRPRNRTVRVWVRTA